MDDRWKDDGSEIYFWFDLSYISSARGFSHDRREPRDACISSSTLNGTWTGGSLPWTRVPEFKKGSHGLAESRCSFWHDALSKLISLRLGARRKCVDGVPTSMTSSLEKPRRGLVAQSSFLLWPLIIFVLGALRSALILCLLGMCFQLPWTGLPGKARRCRSGWPHVWADSHEGRGSLDVVITGGGPEESRIWERVPGPSPLGEHVTSSRGSTPDHRSGAGTARCELIAVGMVGRIKRNSLRVGAQLRLQFCRLLRQLSPTKKKSTPDQIRSSSLSSLLSSTSTPTPTSLSLSKSSASPSSTSSSRNRVRFRSKSTISQSRSPEYEKNYQFPADGSVCERLPL